MHAFWARAGGLDFERVLEKAAGKGIALELNASMYRLDLSNVMARAAQDAGVLLAINSDTQSTAKLEHIRYGVNAGVVRLCGIPRRGEYVALGEVEPLVCVIVEMSR